MRRRRHRFHSSFPVVLRPSHRRAVSLSCQCLNYRRASSNDSAANEQAIVSPSNKKQSTECEPVRAAGSTTLSLFPRCVVSSHKYIQINHCSTSTALCLTEFSILFIPSTADLISLVEQHGFRPHLYADDTQVYVMTRPHHLLSPTSRCACLHASMTSPHRC